MLVVDANGKVNPELTRKASPTLPPAFDDGVYKLLQGWSLLPGMHADQPVRSALPIVLQVPTRIMPMPALVKWSYLRNRSGIADTLRGTWVTAAPEAPMSEAQTDGIYVATVRELVRTHVGIGSERHTYCIAFPAGDSLRARRLNGQLRNIVSARTSYECNPSDSTRRIVLAQAIRTEDNQVSVTVSGDYLPFFPRSTLGRTWRAWRGQCSAPVPANDSAKMATSKGVIQGYTGVAMADAQHQIIVDAQAHGTGSEAELLRPVVAALHAAHRGRRVS
ncbi:MAG: hypothetical protein ABJB74_08510 [Gemmatimonas sp.]